MKTTARIASIRLLLTLATGCGGVDTHQPSGATGLSAQDNDMGAAGEGGGAVGDACEATPLFTPRHLGENGGDAINYIEYDPSSGDLYFSTAFDLYVLRDGGTDPTHLGERPDELTGEFWLRDDRILLPSGLQVPLVDTEVAVLSSVPRKGGEATIEVSVPASEEFGWSYFVGSVEVVEDDVYWIGRDRFNDTSQVLGGEQTYFVRHTNWRSPGEPEELYSSPNSLSEIIVGDGHLFFTEELPDQDPQLVQRAIELASGKVLPETSVERYGGRVVAGAPDSILVTRTDYEDISRFGSYYMTSDGGDETKLNDILLLDVAGPATATQRNGRWTLADLATETFDMHFYTFSPDDGLRDVGCYDANQTSRGIELADDRVVVSTLSNGEASLVAYPE